MYIYANPTCVVIIMDGNFPKKIKSLPLFEGAFEAYKLEANNCDALFASYPAGTLIAPHTHETENHGIITRGELILTMNGKTSRVGIGEWYSIPAQTEHAAAFEVDTEEIEFWFKS